MMEVGVIHAPLIVSIVLLQQQFVKYAKLAIILQVTIGAKVVLLHVILVLELQITVQLATLIHT